MTTPELETGLRTAAADMPLHHPARAKMIEAAYRMEQYRMEAAQLRVLVRNLLSRLAYDPAISDIMAQAESLGVE